MGKLFNQVEFTRPKRNKFDLSHEKKLSCNMGELIPIICQEILPGDRFRMNTEVLLRLAPMLAPVMHRVNVLTEYFFVPNRTIWKEWEDFITGGVDGSALPVLPYLRYGNVGSNLLALGGLGDYFGLPAQAGGTYTDDLNVSALPFRAYQKIYNEYYRDQTLTPEVPITDNSGEITAGPEIAATIDLRKRSWEKDYFTSALPQAQRGGQVSVPVDINYKNPAEIFQSGSVADVWPGSVGVTTSSVVSGAAPIGGALQALDNVTPETMRIENIEDANITIEELRRTARLQEWLEKAMRAGSRYVEAVKAFFGEQVHDYRAQRAEYLGGGRTPVTISEVVSNFQFSGDPEGEPQGNMAGHGLAVGRSNGFTKKFVEHGYVIGIMSIIPRTNYQQGVPKHFLRFDKFDFAFPEFAHIGEQEVQQKELYYDAALAAGSGNAVFGYQSRYAEYKYCPGSVHADMRTNLDFWHLGRKFAAPPVLNASFVECDPDPRIFAVTDPLVDKLWVQLYNKVDAVRPLPYFGTPRL